MLGLMHDHPYVFTPTIAKIMLPVWVCLLVSTVRAIRRDMKREKPETFPRKKPTNGWESTPLSCFSASPSPWDASPP